MKKRIALLLCLFVVFPAHADGVVDGDTLIVGRLKYRLCGIDAPERNEKGYRAATRNNFV